MLKAINSQKIKGFTYIEMLAVLIVVTMIFLFVALKPQYFLQKEAMLEKVANYFESQLKLMHQEAILLQTCYRMKVLGNGYLVDKYVISNTGASWVPVAREEPFNKEIAKQQIRLLLNIAVEKGERPEFITFFPNGSFTPFSIGLQQQGNDASYLIQGDEIGNIELKHEK